MEPESESEPEPEPEVNHHVIVGGGPAGIMAAYNISKNNPDDKILILEKNSNTLDDYIEKDYDNVFNWRKAQIDSDFQYSFASDDDGKSVWLGKGLGGGTLHFGLQYIDTDKLISDTSFNSWKNHNTENLIDSVNNITNPTSYDYSNISNDSYTDLLYNTDVSGGDFYNNKIYKDSSGNRLLLGKLISDNEKIDIQYGTSVKKLNFNDSVVTSVEDFNGDLYECNNCILCAGAIQTPAILQRSGISCGNKLYDHAGFTIVYGKVTAQTTEQIGHTLEELGSLGLNVYNIGEDGGDYDLKEESLNTQSSSMHAVFRHSKLSDSDIALAKEGSQVSSQPILSTTEGIRYVYNMGNYWNGGGHSGGSRFSNLGSDYDLTDTLIGRHGNNYNSRLMHPNATAELVGILKSSIVETTYVPVDLGFDPNSIISHLQTRDDNLNWQTYYSTVPDNDGEDTAKYALILTHAQSTNLSGLGKVVVNDIDSSGNPTVELNHFGERGVINDEYINDLYNAFLTNHSLLSQKGYMITVPQQFPTEEVEIKQYIRDNYDSIYHYHGTCSDIVNQNGKVNEKDNLYIGDISVLNNSWGGSTSFPSLVTGYIASKNLIPYAELSLSDSPVDKSSYGGESFEIQNKKFLRLKINANINFESGWFLTSFQFKFTDDLNSSNVEFTWNNNFQLGLGDLNDNDGNKITTGLLIDPVNVIVNNEYDILFINYNDDTEISSVNLNILDNLNQIVISKSGENNKTIKYDTTTDGLKLNIVNN